MEGKRFTGKLIETKSVNENTKILKFSVPFDFSFRSGQYVRLAFYKDGKRILRDYSIFSSPKNKKFIKIYFKRVEGGYCSDALFNLKVGEEIEMKGPLGDFVLKNKKKDVILISTGTGFSPFKSMVLELLEGEGFQNKLILIRGHRNENDLPCEGRLKRLENENRNFSYYNILSKPKSQSYKLKGHVQDFLEKMVPDNFDGDFYICGLKDMVEDVKNNLEKSGVKNERIFYEKYD